ncbi:MAG TPA: helix-turn-helix transcriptional regulator [Candidatus Saccharimonadales bacterium]|nr:helix-turn-helix transcriptional regulator [Candidatus Saccharimonadales bacterium]
MSESSSRSNTPKKQPYQQLGTRLRDMRRKNKESAAEVSGAVEIDIATLERFEQGVELPSEDILMLLINHFGLGDDEAVSLWELAGYDQADAFADDTQPRGRDDLRMSKQPVIVFALDSRVVYSNGAEIVADKSGVVMNFSQFTDTKQGPVPVAKVGMSYEQAQNVLNSLQRAILKGKYSPQTKQLPAPRSSPDTKKQHRDKKDKQG